MRSSWRERPYETEGHRAPWGRGVTSEAEPEGSYAEAQQGWLAATRSQESGMGQILPQSFQEEPQASDTLTSDG